MIVQEKFWSRPIASPAIATFLLAIAVLLGASTVHAATFNVTSDECEGAGSVTEAMESANNTLGEDTIVFDPGLEIDWGQCPPEPLGDAADYFTLQATESVILEGNGAKLTGGIVWLDTGGINRAGQRCPIPTDIVLAETPGFIKVGVEGADNSAITVTVRDLTMDTLSAVALIEEQASLALENVTLRKIWAVKLNNCQQPAVFARAGANFAAHNTDWNDISSDNEPLGGLFYTSGIDSAGGAGDLTIEDSTLRNFRKSGVISWNGQAGSEVNIVTSRFDLAGGIFVDGEATTNIVNSIWSNSLFGSPQLDERLINFSTGPMNFIASTVLFSNVQCDFACQDPGGPFPDASAGLGPFIASTDGTNVGKINFIQTAVGVDRPFDAGGRDITLTKLLDSFPVSLAPGVGYGADEYTWIEPTALQEADELKAVTAQPNLLTAAPALPKFPLSGLTQPQRATPVLAGELIDIIPDAVCGQANQLINPIDNTCITEDALGNPRVDGNGKRNIGAVQLNEAPHLSVVGVGEKTVDLSWTKPQTLAGLCGYRVTYREKATGNNELSVSFTDPDKLSAQIDGLTNGIEYEFEVAGLVNCTTTPGLGVPSNLVTATPQAAYACAILADREVRIGGSAVIAGDACTNGDMTTGKGNLRTGAKTAVGGSLLGLGDMNLGSETNVNLDVIANGNLKTGARTTIGLGDDGLADLDVDVGGNLRLGSSTQVEGGCRYGGTISAGAQAECGSESPGVDLPLAAPFVLPECAVTPPADGAPNLREPPRGTTALTPGDYGDVSFGARSTVTLAEGEYHFQSLSFGAKTEIEILGPVDLHVVERLDFRSGVQQQVVGGVQPNQILYRIGGKGAKGLNSASNTVLYGTFCAPASTIDIGSGSELWGAAIGKDVTFGARVLFLADPAPVQ